MGGKIRFIKKNGRVIPILVKAIIEPVKTSTGLALHVPKIKQSVLRVPPSSMGKFLGSRTGYEAIRNARKIAREGVSLQDLMRGRGPSASTIGRSYAGSRKLGKTLGALVAKGLKKGVK